DYHCSSYAGINTLF
nr:immunoglobulin light chain junction region [Macaca mulatta]MOW38235.1 immunoglobulin light chain junction region [Macaca mulatta]MOW38792.1 immunoglobulin light chain junction region [Macaca mulatta]MOW38985.1 immunoglobulin light chain junction region [Macaca mulatta]